MVEFLSELARYLLAAGITSARFNDLARLAFFHAASAEARFVNKRLNQSAVAAMTGLTRVQVRAFAKQRRPEPAKTKERLDQLMDGWSSDSGFTLRGAVPKALPFSGKGKTFRALVSKYGGDVPPRALLRELHRHGYVTLKNGNVSLDLSARQTRGEQRLRRTAKMLEELVRVDPGATDKQSPIRTHNLEIAFPATSEKGRLILQRRVSEALAAFMSNVQAAGAAAAMESPPLASHKLRKTRARVALVMEDCAPTIKRRRRRKVKDED